MTVDPEIACNLNAISNSERPRYNDLIKRLRASVKEQSELADGYTYTLEGEAIPLNEVAEWISMERLCCPFLTLRISASGREKDWLLTLTGPKGVKALLLQEFPERPKT